MIFLIIVGTLSIIATIIGLCIELYTIIKERDKYSELYNSYKTKYLRILDRECKAGVTIYELSIELDKCKLELEHEKRLKQKYYHILHPKK